MTAAADPRLPGRRGRRRTACWPRPGPGSRGHEFHRTAVDTGGRAGTGLGVAAGGPEGFVHGGVHASYLHLHWAGSPALAERFVSACAGAGTLARAGGSERAT